MPERGADGERSEKGCGQRRIKYVQEKQQKKGENKSPDTLVRSVFCQREEWVASDPRQDTAEENQVCIRQQNRGENKRPDTSMRSVWCWREAGASSARSEKGCGQENQRCGQPKGGINERPDTMVRSVVWQREKWVANDPKKGCGQGESNMYWSTERCRE
jgi:hypothetical protein